MFVLDGHKRIRAWPDAFFRGKPDLTNRTDYEPYLDASVELDAEPGDVIYWPSSYWHIGEDAGGWSLAISLFFFMQDDAHAQLSAGVARALRERLSEGNGRRAARPARPTRPAPAGAAPAVAGARAIPGQVRRALGAVRALGDAADLEQTLVASRLDHVTGLAFRLLPAPLPPSRLRDEQRVRGDAAYPIRWIAAGDGDLVCSACGRSFVIPANPRVVALLERLNTGAPARVGELARAYATTVRVGRVTYSASRAEIRGLLERLVSLHALIAEPAEDEAAGRS
jgi:hypothetical protein